MKIVLLSLAAIQAVIWSAILRPDYTTPERILQAAMISGAVLSTLAGLKPTRILAILAQIVEAIALLIYVTLAVIYLNRGGEEAEGTCLMIVSGAVLLVILPPLSIIVTLKYIQGKGPSKASHLTP